MTDCGPAGIRRSAAEAALAVSGVLALQPTLLSRLAGAAGPVREAADNEIASPLSGIRVARDPDTGPADRWRYACVLAEGHRAVDVARTVHDRTRASLIRLVAPLTVTVTVIRIARTSA